MRFCIDAVELQRVLHFLQVPVVVNSKDSTGRILIKADADGTCLFLCTNHMKGIYLSIHTDKTIIDKPGEISVVYSDLKSFVMPIPAWDGHTGTKDFCFSAEGNDIIVTTENVHENGKVTKAELKLNKYETYDIRKPKPFIMPTFTLTSDMYKKAINRISYAMDMSELSEQLRGTNIIFTENEIYFAGTDGIKAAELSLKNNSGLFDTSIRLNCEFMQGLHRLLGSGQKVEFEVDANDVKARFGNVVFGSKPIIGRDYVDYRLEFDKYEQTVSLDKDILLDNIRPILGLLNPDDSRRANLTFNGSGLIISCDMAKFVYDGEIKYDGKFSIDFNGQNFYDTLNTIDDDIIILKFSGPMGSLIFDSGRFEDQKAILAPLTPR